jgi:hypothetical protein
VDGCVPSLRDREAHVCDIFVTMPWLSVFFGQGSGTVGFG